MPFFIIIIVLLLKSKTRIHHRNVTTLAAKWTPFWADGTKEPLQRLLRKKRPWFWPPEWKIPQDSAERTKLNLERGESQCLHHPGLDRKGMGHPSLAPGRAPRPSWTCQRYFDHNHSSVSEIDPTMPAKCCSEMPKKGTEFPVDFQVSEAPKDGRFFRCRWRYDSFGEKCIKRRVLPLPWLIVDQLLLHSDFQKVYRKASMSLISQMVKVKNHTEKEHILINC